MRTMTIAREDNRETGDKKWAAGLLGGFFALAIASSVYLVLSGRIALTYDEIWNWLYLSSEGALYSATHYPVPNNHVLFTVMQAVLLPDRLVEQHPPLARVPNILLGVVFCTFVAVALARSGVDRVVAVCASMAIPFLSVLNYSYFVLARGYLLGLLLAFSGSFVLARTIQGQGSETERRRLAGSLAGGALLALSIYTVPTFAILVACLYGIALAGLATHASRASMAAYAGSVAACVLVSTLGYLPIIEGVLANRDRWNGVQPPGAFSVEIIRSLTSSQTLLAGIGLSGIAVWLCLDVFKRRGIRRAREAFGVMLCLAPMGFLVITEALIVLGLTSTPFYRNAHFTPAFVWCGVLILASATLSPPTRRSVTALFFLNAVFGTVSGLSSLMARPLVKEIDVLSYPPAVAFEAHFPVLETTRLEAISCPWLSEPACRFYGNRLGVPVSMQEARPLVPPCFVGTLPLADVGQVILEVEGLGARSLCL